MTGPRSPAAGGPGAIGLGRRARAGALVLVLALTACTSLAPAPPAPSAQGPSAPQATTDAAPDGGVWSGRFSLITTGGNHSNSWTGRYALTRASGAEDRWTLTLFSPLGSVLAQCDWGERYARFTVPDSGGLRTESGPDPESLALSLLGWPLPLSRFPDWIEGRPSAALPAQWDEKGAIVAQFQQQGWVVRSERDAGGALRRLDFLFEPGTDVLTRVRLRLLPGAAS